MEQRKLRHVVLFKFNAGTSETDKTGITKAFSALADQMPGVDAFEWGTDISPEDLSQGFTHCYVLTFHSEADRDAYLPHPAHEAFKQLIGPFVEGAFVVDYWAN